MKPVRVPQAAQLRLFFIYIRVSWHQTVLGQQGSHFFTTFRLRGEKLLVRVGIEPSSSCVTILLSQLLKLY